MSIGRSAKIEPVTDCILIFLFHIHFHRTNADDSAGEIGKLSGIDLVFLFTLKAVCIHLKG